MTGLLPAPPAAAQRPARGTPNADGWTTGRSLASFSSLVLLLLLLLPALGRADALITDCSEAGLRSALGVGGRITFACDGTIVLSNTLLVQVDATLDGSARRVVISGVTNAADGVRLFTIAPGVRFTVANLTLTGGRSTNGGALYNDRGFLSLENCLLTNNLALAEEGRAGGRGRDTEFQSGGKGANGGTGRPAFGGAIYNRLGTTLVNRCVLLTNAAIGGAGGSGGDGGNANFRGGTGGNGGAGARGLGGAIFNTGLLVVSNSTFHLNSAQGGAGGEGGVAGDGFLSGRAGHGGAGGLASGGALYNTNRGRVFLYGSTFSLNSVRGGHSAAAGFEAPTARSGKPGGAALGGAISNFGTNAAVNCTFFANRITGGNGGNGAASDIGGGRGGDGGAATGGQIYSARRTALTNCTVYSGGTTGGTNGAGGDAALDGRPGRRGPSRGGNVANGNGAFLLANCIIADAFIGTNGYGAFTDNGYNLSTDRSIRLRGPGSRTNTPAGLGAFGRNGGVTETVPLLAGSPAIDAGHTGFLLGTDQRGVARPYGARGDIGAYEYGLTLLPPVITTQPQSVMSQVGSAVSFLVVAAGDPPLTYQWRRGTTAIGGATGPMLTLTNLQSSDAATYDVVIANNSGSVTSSGATLSLLGAVAITQQPASITVVPGATAMFSVTATGDAPLRYQWRYLGVEIPGATLTTFTVGNAREADSGTYQVVVANSFSSLTSAPAILTVGTNAPSILTQPEDVTVDSGETAVLSVVANGSQPLLYQWYRNETEPVAGGTNASLVFSNAQPALDGSYTVVVSNALGSATSVAVTLTVNEVGPMITVQPPELLEPCYNDTVSLGVTAQGTEPLFYQWYQDGVAVAGATNATLLLVVQTNQAGVYHVEVSNAIDTGVSTDCVVTVTDAPRIVAQPVSVEALAGTNVVFQVAHCDFPRPFGYQWFLDGTPIPDATNAAYVIPGLTFTDTGAYSVTVTNLFGSVDSDAATLTVLAPFVRECEFESDPINPVYCTLTIQAMPNVEYTGYFRYHDGDEWQAFGSDALPDATPGNLILVFDIGDVNSSPQFQVIGVPLF